MKPTVFTLYPELLSMSTLARHTRLLPHTRAPMSAVVFAQGAMNNVPRLAALAPPGKPPSRVR